MGVENYYSTAYEPWQDGLAEAAVKSTVMTATCGMAESSMVGKFWFKGATNRKNCRNVTYKRHINSTPYRELYRKEKDVSRFKPYGCLAFMHIHGDCSEKGKIAPRAIQVIHLGFATDTNTSAYVVYNPATDKLLTTNNWSSTNHFFHIGRRTSSSRLTKQIMRLTFCSMSRPPSQGLHTAQRNLL
jgi:hypothetical protein